ncbi:glucokinase [Candidatus Methylospira mobilis]|uniref:glucokinase n=1 Tax=Candidatus Methylospira mobilis TaxID=1808979 RepID=UPI001D17855D|nr:glucokinase [Candidatus Methylospira mobilis]WNV03754.1 glucokinase [Candidatus Methylospira mobilis]
MTMAALVLAGDIGGTKTRLALFRKTESGLLSVRDQTYASVAYSAFADVVDDFLKDAHAGELPLAACLGVAGPVRDGRCQTTNLPWLIDAGEIAERTGIARVRLLNDLEATALGVLHLQAYEFVELNPMAVIAEPRAGNIAVLAAGTGLGEALLYWDGRQHHPVATEGGHSDFAANSVEQDKLLAWLRDKHGGHVSCERVLSGPGLFSIYQFLSETRPENVVAAIDANIRAATDPAALIGQCGLEQRDPLCLDALHLFVEIYGAEAGNWALKTLAVGGVVLGGGIAPKILKILSNGTFLPAFLDKGRFRELLSNCSVRVALNPDSALLGAAYAARELSD